MNVIIPHYFQHSIIGNCLIVKPHLHEQFFLEKFTCQFLLPVYMINKFSFTIFHWQGFLVHVVDQQVSLDKFWLLKITNILATFSLLSIYTSKFLTSQFFLVKEKLARQIFLDKENLSSIPNYTSNFSLSRQTCQGKIACVKGALLWKISFFNCRKFIVLW